MMLSVGLDVRSLSRMMDIQRTRTSPRHPQGNGQVERFNRTLLQMIKAYLKGKQETLDLHLSCLAAAYRATPHEATGLTPNLLMMGREVRSPAELAYSGTEGLKQNFTNYGEFITELQENMKHAHQVAREHLHVASRRQK